MGAQSARIGAALRKRATNVVRMLALEIDAELRRATPVDTGHARRNWIPSVGTPNVAEANDESARASGLAEVMRYQLAAGSLWVANVVPYIRALNYGHSQQEPAGFVERAIDIAMAKVRAKGGDVADMQRQFRDEIGGDGASGLAGSYSPFGGSDD
jgi:hypothetical protein